MDTLGLQEFMAGISANTVSQSFDNILEQKYQQPHHNHHHHNLHQNHHQQHQHHQTHHYQQQQQQQLHQNHHHQQQQQSNPSNHQSQNNLFSLFDFPYSPESDKLAYSAGNNLDNGGMDTPKHNDNDMSSLSGELINSDDGLNIAAEGGSISFNRDGSKGSKKSLDKGSDEYKKRRERNNVAVRKSREKAKQRSKDTEKKVSELLNENDNLKRTVSDLNGKMLVLRRLLDDVGVTPSYIDDELNRSFTESHRSKGGGGGY